MLSGRRWGPFSKENEQHLAAKSGPWRPASKDKGPWSYNWKRVNSANNLYKLGSRLFPRPSRGELSLANTLISDFESLNRTSPPPPHNSNPGMTEAGNICGNNLTPIMASLWTKTRCWIWLSCPKPEEMNVQDLKNQLMTAASIQEAMDFLSKEGHIHSTVDDDYF